MTHDEQTMAPGVSRPSGEPTPDNFKLVEAPVPELQDGQVLVRNHYLSLDPYMRGRMNDSKSYVAPQPLNAVMEGGTVGEVVASKNAHFKVGDKVVDRGGWQLYQVVDADAARHAAEGRHHAGAAVGLPGRGRHAGCHGLVWPDEDHRAQGRRDHRRQRRQRCGRQRGRRSWPRTWVAASSAWPAGRRNARPWWMNWASMPASTTSSTPT